MNESAGARGAGEPGRAGPPNAPKDRPERKGNPEPSGNRPSLERTSKDAKKDREIGMGKQPQGIE